ncbi:MAG: hypothetical protein SVU88_02950 [Candidatus Nanohaloarchaea archaeon]|nr:hypothetical protein [Candidatus Nanohaloarchaea archaeon]
MASLPRILVLMALVAAVAGAATAQPFTVDVDVQNPEVNPGGGEAARLNISVTNTGDELRTYTIMYNVANPGWYFLPDYSLTVPPGETRHSVLYAEPESTAIEGNIGVIITVASEGQQVTRRPSYRIVRDRDILITGISTDRTTYRPSSTVNVTLDIKNVRRRELSANAYRAVFTMGGRTKTVSIPSLIASEPETLHAGFRLGQYAKGVKSVQVSVESIAGAVQDTASATVRVVETERIVTERDSTRDLLTRKSRITVRNEGNTRSDGTTVSAELPFYLGPVTSFTPEPARTDRSGANTVYTWEIGSLRPGGSVTVRYRVHYWAPLLLALLLAGAAWLAVREYRKPHVVKRAYRKDGAHTVHLRVENRSGRALEDVVVKDFVPSICSLVDKFDASPPQKIREGGEVTELEWQLGRFEPGEERILTYSLTPQVQVEGEVVLPSAHMEYDGRGKRRKRHSHPARADFS